MFCMTKKTNNLVIRLSSLKRAQVALFMQADEGNNYIKEFATSMSRHSKSHMAENSALSCSNYAPLVPLYEDFVASWLENVVCSDVDL